MSILSLLRPRPTTPARPEGPFFVAWSPETSGALGHPRPVVGQRSALTDLAQGSVGARVAIGLPLSTSPVELSTYGPKAAIFRVDQPSGLTWRGPGYAPMCASYHVAEQLPLDVAFGPHGAAVLSLVERIERLAVGDIDRLASLLPAAPPSPDQALLGRMRDLGLEHARRAAGQRVDATFTRLVMSAGDAFYELVPLCTIEVQITNPRWQLVEGWAHGAVRAALLGDRPTVDGWTAALARLGTRSRSRRRRRR